jgi:hypothetical protein
VALGRTDAVTDGEPAGGALIEKEYAPPTTGMT